MKSNTIVTHYEYDGIIHVKACGNKRIDECLSILMPLEAIAPTSQHTIPTTYHTRI